MRNYSVETCSVERAQSTIDHERNDRKYDKTPPHATSGLSSRLSSATGPHATPRHATQSQLSATLRRPRGGRNALHMGGGAAAPNPIAAQPHKNYLDTISDSERPTSDATLKIAQVEQHELENHDQDSRNDSLKPLVLRNPLLFLLFLRGHAQ